MSDGAVEPDVVVVLDEAVDDDSALFGLGRLVAANSLALESLVPALDLAVGLRIVG